MIKRKDALNRVWDRKYGYTKDLKRSIGEHWFQVFKDSGFIYQGINHPEVWRITDKGRRRCNALFGKGSRFIRIISWTLKKLRLFEY